MPWVTPWCWSQGNRTTNWRSYNAALKQRGSRLIWLDPETVWLAEPHGKQGRSATFTDAAIQACLPRRHRGAQRLRCHTITQERPAMAGEHTRRAGQKRHRPRRPPLGLHDPGDRFPGDWMRCFKLLGERVTARDFDSQVAGLQILAAILNRLTALGTPQTQRVGRVRSREGGTRPQADLCHSAPPCAPDPNPIEMAFSKLKTLIRKAAARTYQGL